MDDGHDGRSTAHGTRHTARAGDDVRHMSHVTRALILSAKIGRGRYKIRVGELGVGGGYWVYILQKCTPAQCVYFLILEAFSEIPVSFILSGKVDFSKAFREQTNRYPVEKGSDK